MCEPVYVITVWHKTMSAVEAIDVKRVSGHALSKSEKKA